jgi:hypothetical protein
VGRIRPPLKGWFGLHEPNLPSSTHGLLHLAWRHGGWWARHGNAGGRVDDGDSIATSRSGGLVKLNVGLVLVLDAGRRDEGRRGGVEREARCHSLRLRCR